MGKPEAMIPVSRGTRIAEYVLDFSDFSGQTDFSGDFSGATFRDRLFGTDFSGTKLPSNLKTLEDLASYLEQKVIPGVQACWSGVLKIRR